MEHQQGSENFDHSILCNLMQALLLAEKGFIFESLLSKTKYRVGKNEGEMLLYGSSNWIPMQFNDPLEILSTFSIQL